MENLFIPNIPFVTDIFVGNTTFRQAIVDNNVEVVKDMLDTEVVKVEDKYMMHMRAIHYACQVDTFNILQLYTLTIINACHYDQYAYFSCMFSMDEQQ